MADAAMADAAMADAATADACTGRAPGAPCAGSAGAAVGGNGVAGAPAANGGAVATAAPASCKAAAVGGTVPVVYVIGDSTASVYGSDLYPRMGWAQPLPDYFPAACARVEDKALSGRSSKSFLEEGAWSPIKGALRRGDFVLIQFGHNDEKREDSARFTEPFGSFQRYLGGYVDDALAAGATPILLTPIERNSWSGGKLSSTHGDYPEAVRQLAQMRQLTLVDMTQLTHAYLERIGQDASSKLFMNLAAGESPNYPSGNMDNTHLQERGARKLAELALAELARQGAPLASLLERVPAPP
jgi:pectinesterase